MATQNIDMTGAWVAVAGVGNFLVTPRGGYGTTEYAINPADESVLGHTITTNQSLPGVLASGETLYLRGSGTVAVTRDSAPA